MQTNEQVDYDTSRALVPVPPIFVLGRRIPYVCVSASVEVALDRLAPLLEAGHYRHLQLDNLQFFDGAGRELEVVAEADRSESLRIRTHGPEIRERVLEQFRWAGPIGELRLDPTISIDYAAVLRSIEETTSFEMLGRRLLGILTEAHGPLSCLFFWKKCGVAYPLS